MKEMLAVANVLLSVINSTKIANVVYSSRLQLTTISQFFFLIFEGNTIF